MRAIEAGEELFESGDMGGSLGRVEVLGTVG